MSRTFEVLERAQQDQELFRVPSVVRAVPGSHPTSSTASLPDQDAFTREEILKLVRCLFMATDRNSHDGVRRVVFCGIDNSDGSSLLCARVSRTLADQVQSQVCVVDANVRTPVSSPLFDLPPYGNSHQSEIRDVLKPLRQVAD